MILLDTHILVWWMEMSPRLSDTHRRLIEQHQPDAVLCSAISVWEIALLVSKGRLALQPSLDAWLDRLLADPTITMMDVSPKIMAASVFLPGEIHGDPADRMIEATAREQRAKLVTVDEKILAYPHVEAVGP